VLTIDECRMLVGAIRRLLADSDRLDDIHLVAEIVGQRRFAALLAQGRREARAILDTRPEIDPQTVDFVWLRTLGPDTLGGAYVRHLDANHLSLYLDRTSTRVIRDPDVGWLIHRYRQVHDIWHVLLGLGVAPHEEVLVHAFVLGLLGLPNSALIVLFGGVQHLVLPGRWTALRHGLWAAWRNGREAEPLLWVEWERLWAEPLERVRAQLRVRPVMVE
jgi:ubiquinone biosynthesis protein Coq4